MATAMKSSDARLMNQDHLVRSEVIGLDGKGSEVTRERKLMKVMDKAEMRHFQSAKASNRVRM
jgi:hypothetical protein